MISRDSETTIHQLLQVFPVVTITGPRQSGKTTLARHVCPDKPYLSLEDPDVRQLLNVQDLETFQRFVRFCAGRSGQILNLSALASDCGITHNTAKAWISVLEASYILFLLRPHHVNSNKRLIKSPKLYFYDTGLMCWLLGIRDVAQLSTHPLRGSIFETLIVSELAKTGFNRGEHIDMHFWRDRSGNEVDVIMDIGTKLMPIEIKAGQTINREFFSALERWVTLAGEQAVSPTLIYGGTNTYHHKGVQVCGWNNTGQVLTGLTG